MIIFLVIYLQVPTLVKNKQLEGKTIIQKEFVELKKNRKVIFPPNGNSIVIFWATWCAPCKLEMNRLKNLVMEGRIPQNKIFAINPFEKRDDYEFFLRKESLPFNFFESDELTQKLEIDKTPTTVFLNGNKIESKSTGISLIGIWKAEKLFSKKN